MKKIGIIFAMNEELLELKKYLEIIKKYNIFDLIFYEARIGKIYIVLVQSGVGKVNAARCTQILIDNIKVNYIFNIGVAGGVHELLNVGDIVIGEKLVQHDFDITAFNHEKGYIPSIGVYVNSDEYLVRVAQGVASNIDNITTFRGVIASGDIFCTDYMMGKKINNKFNALCVEMEGASIAQVCYLSHIPFLVLRSISDTPNNNNVITYEQFLEDSSKKIAHFMFKILCELK
ncbi:MAG: 5'-methylthioadenosine/adenosylhomocysteine nucleosidase [Bacilli bacterium]|nr:5'-methylthioadenosine/adenosylhomocysteine nucleosidase [Bacilli bacterium]MBP3635130.1 5'-methylthioadenosine/adenosylhomocysteine nucleosidase [Bacilli bacterium]